MSARNQVSMLETSDVSSLTRAECAALLAQVKTIEGRLLARLLTNGESSDSKQDTLLDAGETAAILKVPVAWVYRNGRKLGIAVELGTGTLRYSTLAIQRYIAQQRVEAARAVAGKDG